jgi:uncharacterized Zn finger protein
LIKIIIPLSKKAEIMNTKLTLTIEQSVIEKAKKYARKKERSLSDLIENYLKALTSASAHNEDDITPIVKSLKGALPKLPKNFDYKKDINDRLSEKYL